MSYKLNAKIEISIKSPYDDSHQYAGKIMVEDVEYYVIQALTSMQIHCDELDKLELVSFEVINDCVAFECEFVASIDFDCEEDDIVMIFRKDLISMEEYNAN